GVAVDEHDLSAYFADGERSCDVAVGGKDDLVAGADVEREQSQPERLESAADTDCMRGADIVGELALKTLYPRAEDVLRGGGDFVERRVDLVADRLVLGHEVDERDRAEIAGRSRCWIHATDATRWRSESRPLRQVRSRRSRRRRRAGRSAPSVACVAWRAHRACPRATAGLHRPTSAGAAKTRSRAARRTPRSRLPPRTSASGVRAAAAVS